MMTVWTDKPHSSSGMYRSGTTLIEVIAAMVILSTLIASVAVARAKFLAKWREADRKVQVGRALDQIISDWLVGPSSAIPRASQGPLPSNCHWRTHTVPSVDAAAMGCLIVRVEADSDLSGGEQNSPLLFVDLLVHREKQVLPK